MFKHLILFTLLCLTLVACDSKTDAPAETEGEAPAQAEAEAPAEAEEAAEEAAAPAEAEELPMVEVSAEGTKFDPPVQPEQIPEGVYYCDMGTVHYAIANDGSTRCTLCNMMLTKKSAAGAAAGHGHNHDHAGHDHAH
ncbi:hypothetical protein EA187_15705 [Lujinxingia sediminis]|uniref:Uncharacterized protein n=1 Tax=Lujinxingia sediminis TaxID=2480984 RepID=A0ABY0CR04_9DELT|nr:hypothetical protein [Lujinxingia sediminis]RVU42631.1 hypothetical protein EA187_15705 [Lujinxingia sediminis]